MSLGESKDSLYFQFCSVLPVYGFKDELSAIPSVMTYCGMTVPVGPQD